MRISVITPAFNAAATLHRCYDSLCRQLLDDFEWIVVDDGSTDNTAELVKTWANIAPFSIQYLSQPNMGKPSAVNRAALVAKGELCAILDADEAVSFDGLTLFVEAWAKLSETEKTTHWNVVALCEDAHTRMLVGDFFPKTLRSATGAVMRYEQVGLGKKWGAMRTDLLRKNPFPVSSTLKYVPESFIWDRLNRSHLTLFSNSFIGATFLEKKSWLERLKPQVVNQRKAAGTLLADIDTFNNDLQTWFKKAPIFFIKRSVNFARNCLHEKSWSVYWSQLNSPRAKGLVLLALPAGLAVYLRDLFWLKEQEA